MALASGRTAREDGVGARAWARAFEEHFTFIFRTLVRHGVSRVDAEDVAQEVFLVMWRRRDDYEADRPLRPWLAGIATRLALKHVIRRRFAACSVGEVDLVDAAPLPDDRLASARARQLALSALSRLPNRHRTALVRHALDGLSVKDLAALWSVPLQTAYTRVRVARLAFAEVMDDLQAAPRRS
jgi:RNA polymerase sigma-70 factor, ECF subfamily